MAPAPGGGGQSHPIQVLCILWVSRKAFPRVATPTWWSLCHPTLELQTERQRVKVPRGQEGSACQSGTLWGRLGASPWRPAGISGGLHSLSSAQAQVWRDLPRLSCPLTSRPSCLKGSEIGAPLLNLCVVLLPGPRSGQADFSRRVCPVDGSMYP